MNSDISIEMTHIFKPRYPKLSGKNEHLVFNADCDDKPFTIFPEMPGYKTLSKLIFLTATNVECKIRWKPINKKFNRCEGLEFDIDLERKIDSKYNSVKGTRPK